MADDLLKGIGYFIDPSIKNRFGPVIKGAADLFRTPDPKQSYKRLMTTGANINRTAALGNYFSDLLAFGLDAGGMKGASIISKTSKIGAKGGKYLDEKIKDLYNKIGSKKAEKAEEILKDLDDETLMLTKPDDIINILNKGGLEGSINPTVAKNIKNLVKKRRGIDTKYFNIDFSTEKGTQAKKIFDDIYGGVITQGEGAVKLENLYPTGQLGFVIGRT